MTHNNQAGIAGVWVDSLPLLETAMKLWVAVVTDVLANHMVQEKVREQCLY